MTNSTATSISTDGPQASREIKIPELNLILEDETIQMYAHVWDGRFFIHTNLFGPSRPSHIRHYKEILKGLEGQLRDRGFTEYYTMAASESGFRYNRLFGFETNYEVCNDQYEIMKKDIV